MLYLVPNLRSLNLFPLTACVLVLGLVVSLFSLPISYTYGEICHVCSGIGTVVCETCHGSGTCWICGGDGKMDWVAPGYDQWCAACSGSGRCYTCGGVGSHSCVQCGGTGTLTHWMYTAIGAGVVHSIFNVFLFLGLFALSYMASAFYLSFNAWVYDVEDMGFWFNPSFMTWLFAKDRRRWAKWQTVLNLLFAVYFGTVVFWMASLNKITSEILADGTVFSIAVAILFSLIFYKTYVSRLEAPR